jgi:hypothetical protein
LENSWPDNLVCTVPVRRAVENEGERSSARHPSRMTGRQGGRPSLFSCELSQLIDAGHVQSAAHFVCAQPPNHLVEELDQRHIGLVSLVQLVGRCGESGGELAGLSTLSSGVVEHHRAHSDGAVEPVRAVDLNALTAVGIGFDEPRAAPEPPLHIRARRVQRRVEQIAGVVPSPTMWGPAGGGTLASGSVEVVMVVLQSVRSHAEILNCTNLARHHDCAGQIVPPGVPPAGIEPRLRDLQLAQRYCSRRCRIVLRSNKYS